LERPVLGGGPNWNEQGNLPRGRGRASKTAAAHFKVKLPRIVHAPPRPKPTWPPEELRRMVAPPPVKKSDK
jgi:hypothetical protein